ncbi:hypothetical protein pb186bvf_015917 [Paramecium bursaria]
MMIIYININFILQIYKNLHQYCTGQVGHKGSISQIIFILSCQKLLNVSIDQSQISSDINLIVHEIDDKTM